MPDVSVLHDITERGNILLRSEDGAIVAWFRVPETDDQWIEVTYAPDNYPAIHLRHHQLRDKDLAQHLRCRFHSRTGFVALKMNLPDVELNRDSSIIVKPIHVAEWDFAQCAFFIRDQALDYDFGPGSDPDPAAVDIDTLIAVREVCLEAVCPTEE